MRFCFSLLAALWAVSTLLPPSAIAQSQETPHKNSDASIASQSRVKVPKNVILVKGAWSSATDSVTPLPEDGKVEHDTYINRYFGIKYVLPTGWAQRYSSPPPSDSGRYVLAQISPLKADRFAPRGSILITAQDIFFSPLPATGEPELSSYARGRLPADFEVEQAPARSRIGGRSFTSLAYWSPAAQLHWYVLETQIRCHVVDFMLSSRDVQLLAELKRQLIAIDLPPEEGAANSDDVPACIKDYARGDNVTASVEPVLTSHRFNPVPVRIIVDKRGMIKHIHFLSAFPDQSSAIAEALGKWTFKPFLRNGHPIEVETGILFAQPPLPQPDR
jgi:hypothetical protein